MVKKMQLTGVGYLCHLVAFEAVPIHVRREGGMCQTIGAYQRWLARTFTNYASRVSGTKSKGRRISFTNIYNIQRLPAVRSESRVSGIFLTYIDEVDECISDTELVRCGHS